MLDFLTFWGGHALVPAIYVLAQLDNHVNWIFNSSTHWRQNQYLVPWLFQPRSSAELSTWEWYSETPNACAIISFKLSSSKIPPRHATPRHATPRHATPRHATPRHATPGLCSDHENLFVHSETEPIMAETKVDSPPDVVQDAPVAKNPDSSGEGSVAASPTSTTAPTSPAAPTEGKSDNYFSRKFGSVLNRSLR